MSGRLHVVIVGAGFSGSMLAANLLRYEGVAVTLIERDGARMARGLAYGTRRPEHLLNVRASNMSVFPDDPGHFERWLGCATPDEANRFVARSTFGRYAREVLDAALASAPDRARTVIGEARSVCWDEGRPAIVLDDERRITCDRIVLAQGNLPAAPFPGTEALPAGVAVQDAWDGGWMEGLTEQDEVLLIGTGLTAVDVALSLGTAGFRGQIMALSRRGLRPRSHLESGPRVGPVDRPPETGAGLVRAVRQRAQAVGWRAAVDELRPHTQDIWRQMDEAERRRFVRHLRPWWDVHRHRLAPPVAARIAIMEQAGQLRFVGGRIEQMEPAAGRAVVRWRVRGTDSRETGRFARIVDCTGPQFDLARSSDPLIRDLLAHGAIRPDALRLGMDTDRQGRAITADGVPSPAIYGAGPMTRGEAWEIIAVPDIRRQVWDMARRFANSHWVGGEGL